MTKETHCSKLIKAASLCNFTQVKLLNILWKRKMFLVGFITCKQDPGPVHEYLAQVVGIPDQTPPPWHQELLFAVDREAVQVSQGGVARVSGQSAPLGLAGSAERGRSLYFVLVLSGLSLLSPPHALYKEKYTPFCGEKMKAVGKKFGV
jgi:hypothetical protein